MKYRPLGKTGLSVSVIGLGGWALGGGPDWGDTPFADVQSTVSAALDSGINLIDTSPVYGNSETVLGRALKGKRDKVLLATKCGLVKNGSWTDHDLRPQTIVSQLENSLTSLQTDYIDLYWVHYLDPKIPWQSVLETLEKCKEQGKIREIGVCNIPPDILRQMAQTGIIRCVQDEYSILHAGKGNAALQICREFDLGFVAYGTLCGGILSGKYSREPNLRRADARNYFYKCYRGETFIRATETVEQVKQLTCRYEVSPAEVALSWVLAQDGVSCALTGARTPQQIMQNAKAAACLLPKEDLCSLQR